MAPFFPPAGQVAGHQRVATTHINPLRHPQTPY
nr:MAG TPA: hypothetical protein [Bacteriophage sp.]